MAKIDKSKKTKKQQREVVFPLEKTNFIILGIGILTIVAGYLALSGNTVESFRQLTVAPVLLIIGYCVIIPFGIMYRKRIRRSETAPLSPPPPHQ